MYRTARRQDMPVILFGGLYLDHHEVGVHPNLMRLRYPGTTARVIRPEDLQVKTPYGYESLVVVSKRIEFSRYWAALTKTRHRTADMLVTTADRITAGPHVLTAPSGTKWGFYSREDPRMHLQELQKKHVHPAHRVWLERGGRRTFEPDDMPARLRNVLFDAVKKYQHHVEAQWVRLMIQKDWLTFRYQNGLLSLDAYPGTHHAFSRTINMYDKFNRKLIDGLTAEDIAFNLDLVSIDFFIHGPAGQNLDFYLPDIVFEGERVATS
jgi:hypothetical protein